MGNNLFNANISGRLAQALGPRLLKGILVKVLDGTRTSDSTGGLQPTETFHKFRGFDYSKTTSLPTEFMRGTLSRTQKDLVFILGDTIEGGVEPVGGDKIQISEKTYNIQDVKKDPDKATYLCTVY